MRRGYLNPTKKRIIWTTILIILYILLNNTRTHTENPYSPDTIITITFILPVLAGILFGTRSGIAVGILGPLLNLLTPIGNTTQLWMIIPLTIMGYLASKIIKKTPSPITSIITIIIGHIILILTASITPLNAPTISGTLYETFIHIISMLIIIPLYRIGFETEPWD
ncbi:MAG: hypothetical protein Q7R56_03075 [Nanoarchaeota archaeon]|nr:hypothetical protein [Nanoarchaeota archaeon]